MMKALALSQRIYCLMDNDTYDWLSYWKWSLAVGRHSIKYARRKGINPSLQKQQFFYLHRIVAGISRDYLLRFRDRNPLNLQRANMLIKNLRNEPVKWWGSNGVSRFEGVRWDGYYGLWRAHFHDLTIGYYVSEMEAAEAYNEKIKEIGKEDEVVNDLRVEVVG